MPRRPVHIVLRDVIHALALHFKLTNESALIVGEPIAAHV